MIFSTLRQPFMLGLNSLPSPYVQELWLNLTTSSYIRNLLEEILFCHPLMGQAIWVLSRYLRLVKLQKFGLTETCTYYLFGLLVHIEPGYDIIRSVLLDPKPFLIGLWNFSFCSLWKIWGCSVSSLWQTFVFLPHPVKTSKILLWIELKNFYLIDQSRARSMLLLFRDAILLCSIGELASDLTALHLTCLPRSISNQLYDSASFLDVVNRCPGTYACLRPITCFPLWFMLVWTVWIFKLQFNWIVSLLCFQMHQWWQ